MVQDFSTRIATGLAITSGTILTPDQYRLTADASTNRVFGGAVTLSIPHGSRDLGVGSPLYVRMRVTEDFDQANTTVDVVPTVSPVTSITDTFAIEHYRARLLGAALRVGATWHFPLRPISASEALDPVTAVPLWPLQLGYIGVKFIVTGTAFTLGKVQVDITPHVSPDGTLNILGAVIPPKLPVAAW